MVAFLILYILYLRKVVDYYLWMPWIGGWPDARWYGSTGFFVGRRARRRVRVWGCNLTADVIGGNRGVLTIASVLDRHLKGIIRGWNLITLNSFQYK